MAFSERKTEFSYAFEDDIHLFQSNSLGLFERIQTFTSMPGQEPTLVSLLNDAIYCGYVGTYNALWKISESNGDYTS